MVDQRKTGPIKGNSRYGDWPYPFLFAHRGGGAHAPENTLAGMRHARAAGFGAVEFDVKLSADGHPYLLHDDTLERTTSGRGPVAARRWAQLRRLDAAAHGWPGHAREPVPDLAAIARWCRRHDIAANVEIKPVPGTERETGRVVALACARLWSRHRGAPPLLSSFSVVALAAAREAVPALPRGLLLARWRADWRKLADALGCVSLHCHHGSLNPARIAEVKRAGYRLLVYTVNRPAQARALHALGVDAIFTDEALHRLDAGVPAGRRR